MNLYAKAPYQLSSQIRSAHAGIDARGDKRIREPSRIANREPSVLPQQCGSDRPLICGQSRSVRRSSPVRAHTRRPSVRSAWDTCAENT